MAAIPFPAAADDATINWAVTGENGKNANGQLGGAGGSAGLGAPGVGGGDGGNGGNGGTWTPGTAGTPGSGGGNGGATGDIGSVGAENGGGGVGGVGTEFDGTFGGPGGGGGGGGGSGISISGTHNITIEGSGSIIGGNGGDGAFLSGSVGGGGGGGDGITLTGSHGTRIEIQAGATVRGGNGGNGNNVMGTGAFGGDGISIEGNNNVIINAGGIYKGQDSSFAWYPRNTNAISIAGDNNHLEIWSTSVINGNVVANGTGNVFALGGASSGTFDMSTLGVQYQGFSGLEKTGSSTWTLTGDGSSFGGGTTITGGVLSVSEDVNLGAASSALTFNGGTLQTTAGFSMNRATAINAGGGTFDIGTGTTLTQAGVISGMGVLTKIGGGTLTLTGNSSAFAGQTGVNAGTLRLEGQLGGLKTVRYNAALDAASTNVLADSEVRLLENGRLNLRTDNALSSTSTILFHLAAPVAQPSGALALNGFSSTVGRIHSSNFGTGLITNGGFQNSTLTIDTSSAASNFKGIIENGGSGKLGIRLTAGDLTLGGTNTYTGGTAVTGGTLRAGASGAFVDNTNYVVGGGTLDLNGHDLTMASLSGGGGTIAFGGADLAINQTVGTSFAGIFSGSGSLIKSGTGALTLTGDSSTFVGGTTVSGGRLQVDGVLGGDVAARSSSILAGTGRIVGNADLTGGGVLSGTSGQTLSIDGNAVMDGTSVVNVALGSPSTTALFDVGSNLTLDGTLNVTDAGGFGAGIYRLFDYGGTLTDGGVVFGTTPAGIAAPDLSLQTGTGQVNLVNSAGAQLSFWDGGTTALHDNGSVDGGTGIWSAGDRNWTQSDGAFNGSFQPNPTFAVFQGNSGIVQVDTTAGTIGATGMQFVTDGYILAGNDIALQGSGGQSIIRVGDGTSAGAGTTAIITAAFTGNSMLIKGDLGVLALAGTNTYTGGTRIDAGTLAVGADANLGADAGNLVFNGGTLGATAAFDTARSILLTADGRFDVSAAMALGLNGVISGSGNLVKLGAGTLTLTGMNSYTGDTLVQAGTLIGDAGSIRGNIGNAGTVVFDQATNANFAGTIGGLDGTNGAMVKRGAGNLILSGASSLDWTIEAGGLTTAANRFGGDAAILSGGRLAFDQASDALYGGVLSGSGAFELAGAGTVTLTGNSSAFTGTTTVGSGNRLVVGTFAGGALGGSMTIGSGGLLSGTGRVGSSGATLTIAGGAVHAPGNSIGVQTIAGNYVNHGTLRIEATPAEADKIVVAGSVDITGAALDLVLSPTDASGWGVFNGPFTIIDKQSAGAVIGAFDPVTQNLLFLNSILDYAGGDGNDVTLALERNDIAFAEVGSTRNQIATGGAIETLDNTNPLWRSIALTNDPDIARASFDVLSGEIHTSVKTALIEDSRFLRNAVNDRIRAAFDGVGAPGGMVMIHGEGGAQAAATTDRAALWGQAFGSWGDTNGDGNAARLNRSTNGFFFGADAPVFDTWRFGAVAGYSNSSFDVKDRFSSGSSDNYHLGLYGGTAWGDLALRTGVAYTWHDISSSRGVSIPGVSDSLKGDYTGGTAQAFGELGYRVAVGGVAFEPFANLAHVNLLTDGFIENGGAAALSGAAASMGTTFTTLGLRASTTFNLNGASLTAKGMLGWRHAFGSTVPETAMRFGAGDTFTIAGAPIARNAAVIEVGLDYAISPSSSAGVLYGGQFGGGFANQSFKANLNVKF